MKRKPAAFMSYVHSSKMEATEARTMLDSARRRVDKEISSAVLRARSYLERRTKYEWGGKTGKTLDCSGLIQKCYPDLYPGIENQFRQLQRWTFTDNDLRYAEVGDVIFFAEPEAPKTPIHAGIVESVSSGKVAFIHSSEARGSIAQDEFVLETNIFQEFYLIIGVAKIRPFLFRLFLNDEISRSLKSAN